MRCLYCAKGPEECKALRNDPARWADRTHEIEEGHRQGDHRVCDTFCGFKCEACRFHCAPEPPLGPNHAWTCTGSGPATVICASGESAGKALIALGLHLHDHFPDHTLGVGVSLYWAEGGFIAETAVYRA